MPTANHPGLRLSLVGAAVFILGIVSLLFLPDAIAVIAMLVGGVATWSGFVWTLLAWYRAPQPPAPPDA